MEPERTALVIQPRVSMLAFQYNLHKTMTVDQEFEANILAMRIQPDEENFEGPRRKFGACGWNYGESFSLSSCPS